MQRVAAAAHVLVDVLAEFSSRLTHHSSIAPTGTISLPLANHASNGIEPSFAHHYFRNVIREGKKSKEKIDVFSFELLAYRELVNPKAIPGSQVPGEMLPEFFVSRSEEHTSELQSLMRISYAVFCLKTKTITTTKKNTTKQVK